MAKRGRYGAEKRQRELKKKKKRDEKLQKRRDSRQTDTVSDVGSDEDRPIGDEDSQIEQATGDGREQHSIKDTALKELRKGRDEQ